MRILCALALLFVGFGHQPAGMAENTPFNVAAYALPDGTLPVLCVSESDDSQKDSGKHIHAQGCEACRISASVLLPSPVDNLGERMRPAAIAPMRPFIRVAQRRILSPSTAPRAPPFYLS